MIVAITALKGYAIEASDGRIGAVSDFLFSDETWKLRWLVVDTGTWLTGRKVLIHPSAIGGADHVRQNLQVKLTTAQVKAAPDILEEQPVSRQHEARLYNHYGWDPLWEGSSSFPASAMSYSPLGLPPYLAPVTSHAPEAVEQTTEDGDPHLRSCAEVKGYHIHATDGDIGHVETFLVDDTAWSIRYIVVDTRNWWPGQQVLLSPAAVREVSWGEHQIRVDVTRAQVKAGPQWDPAGAIDQDYEQRLHAHYGWRGFGW